jgi:monoamine oxidase
MDPYSKMSYTYLGKDSTPDDCSNIAEPIDNKVYFAGEHCCFDFIGTVNGAYTTGVQAAERLIGNYVANFVAYLMILPILV